MEKNESPRRGVGRPAIEPPWRQGRGPRTGAELRLWLKARGLSQTRFAGLIGVMPNTVNKWAWRGARTIPVMAETLLLLFEGWPDMAERLQKGPTYHDD